MTDTMPAASLRALEARHSSHPDSSTSADDKGSIHRGGSAVLDARPYGRRAHLVLKSARGAGTAGRSAHETEAQEVELIPQGAHRQQGWGPGPGQRSDSR